jgi:hypothetical protein
MDQFSDQFLIFGIFKQPFPPEALFGAGFMGESWLWLGR